MNEMPEYVPMRVSYVVISRPGRDLKWWEQARFDDPIAASDYCIFLRGRASNPGFECMWVETKESADRRLCHAVRVA